MITGGFSLKVFLNIHPNGGEDVFFSSTKEAFFFLIFISQDRPWEYVSRATGFRGAVVRDGSKAFSTIPKSDGETEESSTEWIKDSPRKGLGLLDNDTLGHELLF